MRPLAEQVIVITGASSGIGRATALVAARRGARLALAARGAEALEETQREVEALGAEAIAAPIDVADYSEVEALGRQTVERFGRIDTWVNGAAVTIYGEFVSISPDEFRRVIEVNLLGAVHGAMVALARMRDQDGGGTIVNISSALGDRAAPLQAAYSAAKHGLNGFSEALRVELEHGRVPVRVAVIKPASIDTPFFQHARTKMGVAPKPMPPVYDPDLVAEAILHAATHAVRELPVGGASAGLSTLEKIAPRLIDRQLTLAGYRVQQADEPKPATAPDNLFAGSTGPGAIRGGYDGRRFSLYTWLKLHPFVRPVVLGAAALAGVAVARGRRT